MRHTIHITQEDIDKGEPESPCFCPVARAMLREFDRAVIVSSRAYSFYTDSRTTRQLPDNVIQWIADFDCRKPVAPFEFDVEV